MKENPFVILLSIVLSFYFIKACDSSTSADEIQKVKPEFLWGIGDQISGAKNMPVDQDAPVGMITSSISQAFYPG